MSVLDRIRLPAVDFDAFAEAEDIARIRCASEYRDQVIEDFHNPQISRGRLLPWSKTHAQIQIRKGELSLWAGINGHGKSQLLGQVILGLMKQGDSVCVASLEMQPRKTLGRMARQALGVSDPSIDYLKRFHGWLVNRMWLYDQTGAVKPRRMVGVSRYCVQELHVDHVVIDSMMKCGIAEDDYNAQKQFVDVLATLARDTGLHVHLVVHSRKRESEKHVMDKFDIRGSGSISDLSDNVFTLWRNKAKESEAQKPEEQRNKSIMERGDAVLKCDKQRHGEFEGAFVLWFDKSSMQFTSRPNQTMDMLASTLDGYPHQSFAGSPMTKAESF